MEKIETDCEKQRMDGWMDSCHVRNESYSFRRSLDESELPRKSVFIHLERLGEKIRESRFLLPVTYFVCPPRGH